MEKNHYKSRRYIILGFLSIFIAFQFSAKAAIYPFSLTYSGAQEVPPNASPGTGTIVGTYNDVNNTIYYTINFSGLLANVIAAHFHAPALPGISVNPIITHSGFPTGVTFGTYSNSHILTDLQETQLLTGLMYSNIHTTVLPGGEIRSQIILGAPSTTIYSFTQTYSGSQEVPPNASPGTGTITGTFDPATNIIFYSISFSGLLANVTAAHFHAPAPPGISVNPIITHSGFPTGVTFGTYSNSHVLTDLQETQLLTGLMYSNIHTTLLPGGEIRAQIIPVLVPTITCSANSTVNNDPGLCTASVTFASSATGAPVPGIVYTIGTTVITSPFSFPVGTTTVTATATNSEGTASCTFTVTVNDNEAPVIANMSATPPVLWPPNHKMRDITVNYTSTDNCPGVINCGLSVTSNEQGNSRGSGNTSPDWEVVNAHHVRLRAERSGNGTGRIYTITATCSDQYGNTSSRSTTVTVPHDNSSSFTSNLSIFKDVEGLSLRILANPTTNYFTLDLQPGKSSEKMNVLLYDIAGRTVESRKNLGGNQMVRLGTDSKPGIYFIHLKQGTETIQMKVVKL